MPREFSSRSDNNGAPTAPVCYWWIEGRVEPTAAPDALVSLARAKLRPNASLTRPLSEKTACFLALDERAAGWLKDSGALDDQWWNENGGISAAFGFELAVAEREAAYAGRRATQGEIDAAGARADRYAAGSYSALHHVEDAQAALLAKRDKVASRWKSGCLAASLPVELQPFVRK